ncbi:GMC oxidoreductase [Bosea sp. BH3]|uniref:GMC oxidoreductase n=1 Tax=Bosea sp. BH3 TaxID=2871701 RepID=UPI003966CD61
MAPGPDCISDEDWIAFACDNGQTICHACGTAGMDQGPGAVVDPQLRVRGIEGPRIADASIMPGGLFPQHAGGGADDRGESCRPDPLWSIKIPCERRGMSMEYGGDAPNKV